VKSASAPHTQSVILAAGLLLAGCGVPVLPGGGPCEPAAVPVALPPEVRESSGLAPVSGHPGMVWTHNDSGWPAELFAVTLEGRLVVRVQVTGAENVDWEELARVPCGEAGDEACLLIADTGDNLERRVDPALYRVPEPVLPESAPPPDDAEGGRVEVYRLATAPAERFPLRFPDGPRDVEAMVPLADGRVLLITKGRSDPVEVYRTPQALGSPGEPIELERIQRLTERPASWPARVTGAAITPAGEAVGVRTYESLRFYRIEEGGADGAIRLAPVEGGWVNLRPLREPQGEAVLFLPGNRAVLSSEAGPGRPQGQLSMLECRVPGVSW